MLTVARTRNLMVKQHLDPRRSLMLVKRHHARMAQSDHPEAEGPATGRE